MYVDRINQFLISFIKKILIDENNIDVRIILSNQNAPRPRLPYITISDPPISTTYSYTGNWEDRTDSEGKLYYVFHFQSNIRLEQIGGNGNYFMLLLESLNRQDIKDYWYKNNLSLLGFQSIGDMSDITEDIIEKRTIMDINVSYDNTNVNENGEITKKNYNTGWIETVQTEGNYEN